MGIDAMIYFRSKVPEPQLDFALPQGVHFGPSDGYGPEDCTHSVDGLGRYYGEGYERGNWPHLASVLMMLLASPDIVTVWYGGDCGGVSVVSREQVLATCEHWMQHGTRPYRGAFR